MLKRLKQKFLEDSSLSLWIYLFISTAVAIHKYFTNKLANYMTFSGSFKDIMAGLNPYYQVLEYKYSPAFSIFMGSMAVLPDLLGAILWNALNTVIFYIGVSRLKIEERSKVFILCFVIFEYLTSIQNLQSNVMMSGLMLIAFYMFEKDKTISASFLSVSLFFIKIFGSAIAILFMFYKRKSRFLFFSILWSIVLIFIPLILVNWGFFILLYKSWLDVVVNDFSATTGVSVMSIISLVYPIKKEYLQFGSLVILALPLMIKFKRFESYKYRLGFVASILIWMIIFNHKAESPTYIIAVTGVALWYVISKRNILNIVLLSMVFIFTTLSPTDLFPKIIFKYVNYNIVKALPCVLVWIKLQVDLLSQRFD